MPTESADDNGQLNKEQVALALQNVSHIFGDEAVDSGSTPEAGSKFSRMHSGRNRVDSAARPPQFMQNNNAKKGATYARNTCMLSHSPIKYTHTHTHTHVLMHARSHSHTHMHARTHTHTYTHTYTHAHTHTHTHTHVHTYTHTYTHTHAQASYQICKQMESCTHFEITASMKARCDTAWLPRQ